MPRTDALARSFFDLWHHLDPIGAGRFDPEAPVPAVVGFDHEGVRQHLVALRALAAAAEELELSRKEDEVDRTLLLDAIRGLEHRFLDGGPYRDNPAFWLDRLGRTMAVRPQDPDVLAAIPPLLDLAKTALAKPAPALLLLALEQIPLLQALVLANSRGDSEDRERARAALIEFDGFLRHDLKPGSDQESGTLGVQSADWTLHYGFGLESPAATALRQVARQAEALEADLSELAGQIAPGRPWRELVREGPARGPAASSFALAVEADEALARSLGLPALPGVVRVAELGSHDALAEPTGLVTLERRGALEEPRIRLDVPAGWPLDPTAFAARYGRFGAAFGLLARRSAESEVRRRYVAPGWLLGFGVFAIDWLDRRGTWRDARVRLAIRAEELFGVLVAAVDLSIHLRQLTPDEAERRLSARFPASADRVRAAVRGTLMTPLDAAGAALVLPQWTRLAQTAGEEPERFATRIASTGILHPATAGWHLDLGG